MSVRMAGDPFPRPAVGVSTATTGDLHIQDGMPLILGDRCRARRGGAAGGGRQWQRERHRGGDNAPESDAMGPFKDGENYLASVRVTPGSAISFSGEQESIWPHAAGSEDGPMRHHELVFLIHPASVEYRMTNSVENLEIIPTGGPLGAQIRGVDFALPVDACLAAALNSAWAAHLVLLFRGQDIDDAQHIAATALFGAPAVGAGRSYFEKPGRSYFEKQGRAPADGVAGFPEIAVISNLGPSGEPVMQNEGLGSGEVVWHSDNSYIETPPAGSFLRALEVPPEGGNTAFTNQYLAYDTLPADVKARLRGLHARHDSSRNSAGVARPGVSVPKTLADVPGPDHPLVRLHPVTGRKALYLGRRRIYPSQYIVGWDRAESEALLDYLWDHASQRRFEWAHGPWRTGDMLLWDNRCVMHHRDAHSSTHRRIMHRTQMGREKPIAA